MKSATRIASISVSILAKTAVILTVFLLLSGKAEAVCSVTTTGLVFGNYDVSLLTATTSTGSVTVGCDNVPPINVTIMISQSPNSGGFAPRLMRHASLAEFLSYNLYQDAAMLNIWGDGTLGTSTLTIKPKKNKPAVATVYGMIPPGQDVNIGLYSDTLTVTVLP